MNLITSLCAIRVANVPEVCVEGKRNKKRKRHPKTHKRRVRISRSEMTVSMGGSGTFIISEEGRIHRIVGGLTVDGGVGHLGVMVEGELFWTCVMAFIS